MNLAKRAYLNVFKLVPETCKIAYVKRKGSEKNEAKDKVYKFDAIIEAPTDLPDTGLDKVTCKELRKEVLKNDLGGPDIGKEVKLKNKGKKSRKRKFVFTAHLSPENVDSFQIINGLYRIKMTCYGVFY